MPFAIRPYHPSDLCALYRICLQTGDSGADATRLYRDPDLLGHYYAGPYAVFEPDLCFVLTAAGQPCGYILGARDTPAFAERCAREWFPALRARYPAPAPDDRSPEAQLIRMVRSGEVDSPGPAGYPAHLHIDLLPQAQGRGWGHQLMRVFLERLRQLGVGGVHLGVAAGNARAVRFYERAGFARLETHPAWMLLGRQIAD